MVADSFVANIRKSINENLPYNEYKKLFFEYIEYLEDILKNNPQNIKAVCQLAIAYMEVREPAEKSIEIMENALNNFEEALGTEELTELLTNLAYFYEKEMHDVEKAKYLLERAVGNSSEIPNTYNELGIIYFQEGKVEESIKLFSKAILLSKDIQYLCNYAVALYESGEKNKSANIFYEISREWKSNEVAEIAYYYYGMIKSIIGDFETGLEIASNLFSIIESANTIDECRIANLFFTCGDYERCIEIYESENLYPSLDWLKFYFYSYHKSRPYEMLRKVFDEVINSKEREIQEEKEDNDENWTKEERRAYIEDINKDIKDITALFNCILNNEVKPEVDFKPEPIYKCYLIDCPRHAY